MFKSYRNVVSDEKSETLTLLGNSNEKQLGYAGLQLTTRRRERYPYPVGVIYILLTKCFEAFAANGIRTILALYLRDDLNFSENFSTIMLHIFNFFGQFCPIIGAVLADSYFGNIRTISYFFILYGVGWFGLILTSFPLFGFSLLFLVSLSLLLVAIGNGSIRACVTSLGAVQFSLPEQSHLLVKYFSLYYFFYYVGIFLSKIVPPLIRAKTSCFNKDGCYPAVFGTLGSAFMASWIVFIIGKIYYKDENISSENILLPFFGCIKHAIKRKIKNSNEKRTYWLHYSIGRYSKNFVNDVTIVLKIFKLFSPLPIYFALLVQQDSSWTFQASQMNTTIVGMKIEPDQAKAIGPIILFSTIPIWQYMVVPILKYWNIEIQPLISMIIGGIFAGLAFISSGILQIVIQKSARSISISWQAPQFFLLMLGELFLSIPGLQFAFTQAPHSMKSVVTAAWFVNNAFGNLIVVLITKINPMGSQAYEYFFYSLLMFVSIGIFCILSCDYNRNINLLEENHMNTEDDINNIVISS